MNFDCMKTGRTKWIKSGCGLFYHKKMDDGVKSNNTKQNAIKRNKTKPKQNILKNRTKYLTIIEFWRVHVVFWSFYTFQTSKFKALYGENNIDDHFKVKY